MSDRKDTLRSLQDQRKKLVEQRDEARAALEAERQNPLVGQLLEDKQALGLQVTELTADLMVVRGERDHLQEEKQEQQQLINEMLEKFTALKHETVALKEHYDAELTKLKTDYEAEVVKLRADDVASLKKRLAQKAEELRLMTQARDGHQAAAVKLKTERDQAHGVLALVPKEVIQTIRESLSKPKLVTPGTPVNRG